MKHGARGGNARPSTNKARLMADVRRLLSLAFQRDISDPALVGMYVTRVEPTAKSHEFRVWVHRHNETDSIACMQRFERVAPFITHELRKALPHRRFPKLSFCWDKGIEMGDEMIHLLRQLQDKN
ncbi:MAG: ribosome-binding factor A [Mariprofundales bacterium]